ncbi:peroxiredoxin [Burkholderiaceae bacterium DAT-1]|nr:peroxiredoxin [Burkholderiaceae bacterium DAT-1]
MSVPAIQLNMTGDKQFDTAALKGKTWVLYFYPKDSTPGCTVEGGDFRDHLNSFLDEGVQVFGASRDSIKSHENFRSKQGYTFDLVSDPEEVLCEAFGVMKLKNMYGKQVRGIERSTFVINTEGEIIKEWRGIKVPGHVEEVLTYVRTLKRQ